MLLGMSVKYSYHHVSFHLDSFAERSTHKACHCQIKMTCQISQFRTLPAMDMYMRPYLVSIAVGHCHEWHCQHWLQIFNNAASLSLPKSCCVVTMECYGRGNNHCPIVAMSVPWPLLDSCHVSTMDIVKFALKNEFRFLQHCWQLCGNISVSYTHLTLPTKRIV